MLQTFFIFLWIIFLLHGVINLGMNHIDYKISPDLHNQFCNCFHGQELLYVGDSNNQLLVKAIVETFNNNLTETEDPFWWPWKYNRYTDGPYSFCKNTTTIHQKTLEHFDRLFPYLEKDIFSFDHIFTGIGIHEFLLIAGKCMDKNCTLNEYEDFFETERSRIRRWFELVGRHSHPVWLTMHQRDMEKVVSYYHYQSNEATLELNKIALEEGAKLGFDVVDVFDVMAGKENQTFDGTHYLADVYLEKLQRIMDQTC